MFKKTSPGSHDVLESGTCSDAIDALTEFVPDVYGERDPVVVKPRALLSAQFRVSDRAHVVE